MVDESTEDWDLESLTGCNRDLFMRLAGLGRINMLSQQPASPYFKQPPPCAVDDDDDDEAEPLRNEHDGRDEFWFAWNAMKRDLHSWKPCTRYAATPSRHKTPDSAYSSIDFDFAAPGSPTRASRAHEAVEKNHWLHASNVYRYAAILYLDRLAYPHLPSSHHVFQNTVRAVLDHLNCIPAASGLSKSLLWPVFVTGAECVVDEHRFRIRERCFEMQGDCGFWNKMSGLDVLESIWCEEEFHDDQAAAGGRGGLRWTKFTQRKEGEYLMV